VVVKDKKSVWFLEAAAPEVAFVSDRTYAIVKLPAALRGAGMLVRTSADVADGIPIGRLRAAEDCTAYAAILWRTSATVVVDRTGFRRLEADGWQEVPGRFETTAVGDEGSEWKVYGKPLEKGSVYVDMRIPRTNRIFFFQARGGSAEKPPPAPEAEPGKPSPVVIKDKKSVWLLETAAPEVRYLSDRDYALFKLPGDLRGATLLVRTSGDVHETGLPIGVLTATQDCTAFAAILWNPDANTGGTKNAFRRLLAEGWNEVPGKLVTTGMAEGFEWKVLRKPQEKGGVHHHLQIPPAHVLFFFK
jgi:hypothetical protein